MCGLRSPTAKISTLTNSRQKPKHARGLTPNQPLGSKSTGEADTSKARGGLEGSSSRPQCRSLRLDDNTHPLRGVGYTGCRRARRKRMALSSFPASAILVKMPGDHDSVSLTTAENAAEALAFAMRIDRAVRTRGSLTCIMWAAFSPSSCISIRERLSKTGVARDARAGPRQGLGSRNDSAQRTHVQMAAQTA